MEINTERLLLVPCTLEIYSERSKQYNMGPHIEAYLEELKEDHSLKGWGIWLIISKETDQVVGDIGFKGTPNEQKTVEIGYGILPTEHNKGFATEAVKSLVDWAFSTGQVDIIEAECLEDNFASIRVLKKLGMKRTSTKDGMLYWNLVKE